VYTLSPSTLAFGDNFNKAALVFLTLVLPALRVHELPSGLHIWAAVVANIAAFSAYIWTQITQRESEARQRVNMMKLQETEEDFESEWESEGIRVC